MHRLVVAALALTITAHAVAQLLPQHVLDSVGTYHDLEKALREPEKVYRLDLSGKKPKEVPEGVRQLKNLNALDLGKNKLRELRGMGLRIALDDFGTGFSSLAYLSKLPLDALKIDRSFIHAMDNVDDTSIISTIITLAQSLRLNVVAEGVETDEQAQLLRLLRCQQAQGYLFSPPVPPERIEAMLRG